MAEGEPKGRGLVITRLPTAESEGMVATAVNKLEGDLVSYSSVPVPVIAPIIDTLAVTLEDRWEAALFAESFPNTND